MAAADKDVYGNSFTLYAEWSRHFPHAPDYGFPVPALAHKVRKKPILLAFGYMAGLNRGSYETFVYWCEKNWTRFSPTAPETYRKGWITEFWIVRFLMDMGPWEYHREDGSIWKHTHLLVLDHFQQNHEDYTLANTEPSRTHKGYLYFHFVDAIPTKVVQVPVLEVTLDANPEQPKEKHEPTVEFTPQEIALAAAADVNGDGVLTTEEVKTIDTNGDKTITLAEVQAGHRVTEAQFDELVTQAINDELDLEAFAVVPENAKVPTPQETVQNPKYRQEETFQTNFIIQMLDELNKDVTINIEEFIIRVTGVLAQNWRDLNLNILAEAARVILAKLTGTGQLRLTKEEYVGEGKLFTEEEFARIQLAIDEREDTFTQQQNRLNNIQESLPTVTTTLLWSLLQNRSDVQSFDRRLSHVERTYVRL